MANISIGIKNLESKIIGFKKNLVVLFYAAFIVLLFFEFFVVQQSLSQMLDSNKQQEPSHSVQKVRVNFTDYDADIKKIEAGQNFSANIRVLQNPFKTK